MPVTAAYTEPICGKGMGGGGYRAQFGFQATPTGVKDDLCLCVNLVGCLICLLVSKLLGMPLLLSSRLDAASPWRVTPLQPAGWV